MALKKAGKAPTREQIKKLINKYDTDKNGTLEFHEYQAMVKDWDAVMEEFDNEEARMAAALAAAEPVGGGRRSRKSSKELPDFDTADSGRRSRRDSRELLPNMQALDLSPGQVAVPANTLSPIDQLPAEQREALMAHMKARGAGNRRRSI